MCVLLHCGLVTGTRAGLCLVPCLPFEGGGAFLKKLGASFSGDPPP